jgi:hypothetical protein
MSKQKIQKVDENNNIKWFGIRRKKDRMIEFKTRVSYCQFKFSKNQNG